MIARSGRLQLAVLAAAMAAGACRVETQPAAPGSGILLNGSFETGGAFGQIGAPLEWEGMAMGTFPAVVQDCTIARDGKCSMKIMADRHVLASVVQTVDLKPNQLHVLTGWVRTERLEVLGDADMYGTLTVIPDERSEEGQTITGPSHGGDTDWTPIRVEFVSPSQGKTNILCSFCGQGVARGTVWFDDIRLTPSDKPRPATSTAPVATRPARGPTTQPAATQPGKSD